MPSRLTRRLNKAGPRPPLRGVAKNMSTSQGQYTLYAVVICTLVGMLLTKVLPGVIQTLNNTISPQQATDLGAAIAFGITGVILIIALLNMRTIFSVMQQRRAAAYEKRWQLRKQIGD
jgi:hypothetical protein